VLVFLAVAMKAVSLQNRPDIRFKKDFVGLLLRVRSLQQQNEERGIRNGNPHSVFIVAGTVRINLDEWFKTPFPDLTLPA
jgi:hypothetical protein